MNGMRWVGLFWGGSLLNSLYLVIPFMLYYTCFLAQKLWIGKDAAVYVLLASSLAEGKGYFDYFLAITHPHAHYPPGYPFILAVIIKIFGEQLLFLRLPNIVFCGVSLIVLIKILRNYLEGKELFFVFLLFALNPLFINFTHTINTEAVYLLFSWLGIYVFLNNANDLSAKKTLWGALAIIAGLYFRAIGISLYLSLFIYLLIKKKYRQVMLISLLGLFILPWIIYSFSHNWGYGQIFMMKDVYDSYGGVIKFADIAIRFSANLKYYAGKLVSDTLFYPYLKEITFGNYFFPLKISISLFFSCLFLAGFYYRARKLLGIVEIYIFFYTVVLIFHPYHDERFLLPIYPFLLSYLMISLRSSKLKFAKIPIILVLSFALILANINAIRNIVKRKDFNKPAYAAALSWLKNNTSPKAIIMSGDPAGIYFYTQRKGSFLELSADPAQSLAKIREKNTDFLFIEKDGLTVHGKKIINFDQNLTPLLEKYPDDFILVYQASVKPEASIYRVNLK